MTPDSWAATFGQPLPFRGQRAVIVMGDTHRARQVIEAFPDSPLVEYTVAVMNASLAAMKMNIAAEALGVSSVMLSETGRSGLLDAAYLKEALALPEGVVPIMTIVFGFAKGAYPPMPPKLPLDQVCFEGRYREADPPSWPTGRRRWSPATKRAICAHPSTRSSAYTSRRSARPKRTCAKWYLARLGGSALECQNTSEQNSLFGGFCSIASKPKRSNLLPH